VRMRLGISLWKKGLYLKIHLKAFAGGGSEWITWTGPYSHFLRLNNPSI
jgi:hypothetical protein